MNYRTLFSSLGVSFVLGVLFPCITAAAGPMVHVDIQTNTITITHDESIKEYAINTITYKDAKDIQAMRIERNGIYYIVTLIKKGNYSTLRLYTEFGALITKKTILTKTTAQNFSVIKLSQRIVDNKQYFRIRAIKLDKAGKPIRYIIKEYYVRPTSEKKIKRSAYAISQKITYPSFSGMSNTAAGMALLNYERKASGLLPVDQKSELNNGCAAHVEYLRLNNILTHYEDPSQSGYTEEGAAAGTASNLASQSTTDMRTAIHTWTTAIYHRFPLLVNGLQSVGWAVSSRSTQGKYYVCINVHSAKDFAEVTSNGRINNTTYYDPYNHDPIPYPGVNEEHIPSTFSTGEIPDPLEAFGGTYPSGQPISLTFSTYQTVKNMRVTLTDATGAGVAGYLRNPDDPGDPNELFQGNSVSFIPKSPLKNDTQYTVTVSGKLNDTDYSKTWKFTTE
ncbi:MAG TPA: CAP domain-containing protein [Patescibacteria group bacterium]|nr:CAP domain-containing protein [Patescibacteria group bacterium]